MSPQGDGICDDLRAQHRSGRLSIAEFLREFDKEYEKAKDIYDGPAPAVPDELRVNTADAIAIVGRGAPPPNKATLGALNAILSGPPASAAAQREAATEGWPTADPVVVARNHGEVFVLAFASEVDAKAWIWKMNYQCFAKEGAVLPYTQAMVGFSAFRFPESLSALLTYVGRLDVVADMESEFKLKLADGAEDKAGRYEPGRGPPERLSAWAARTIRRLGGAETYATAPASEP